MTIQQILLKYWGYSSFRPLQEEIIQSVLDGKDTLALLPTGGGKSITFQVPALAREGLCLVVSPLIALMKDQVDNLKKKEIKAAAVYSGMHADEIDIILNNCRLGEFKLLYVSPERLVTEKMRDAIRRIKINLIAVDEAHCISQWGYDFRPPYLQIAGIREFLPGVPVLALTATATEKVVKDIQVRLLFRQQNVIRKSFERKNLTYYVFKEEDKLRRLTNIINKVKGCGIIYVRNRKHTKDIATYLVKKGIQATWYHAGLDPRERVKRQNEWINDKKQVMVATNAFGMGIDKPDVRFVVHMDLPDSLEAYFQEAGRAGRDEKRSYAVLLYETSDIINTKNNLSLAYPGIVRIRKIYQALGNYFQIPVGAGRDHSFEFDIARFSSQYNFPNAIVYNALKFLEKEGYLVLSEGIHQPPAIYIKTDKETLYRFQVENEKYDSIIKLVMRSYSGLFSSFVNINEEELARRADLPAKTIINNLNLLEKMGVLDYRKQSDKPQVMFTEGLADAKNLYISPENYADRVKDAERRLNTVINYAENHDKCHSQVLLSYFNEVESKRCGKCDICLKRNKIGLNDLEYDAIRQQIVTVLTEVPCTLIELVSRRGNFSEDKMIKVIQWLTDQGLIKVNEERKYYSDKVTKAQDRDA
ncbi:MAG: RecQ family ATP-dependent DNA helicase [Bacteroidetes bacterium]|nr:RecQ family ATP-dependent DNA helicase [Bacteroidota bacterium]